jgi:hypothetical protein
MTLLDPEGYMTEIRRSHKVARTQACGDGSMNRPPHVRRVSVLMSESIRSKAVVPAIDAHLAVDLIVDGEPMPVFVWTIVSRPGLARIRSKNRSSTRAALMLMTLVRARGPGLSSAQG